MALWFDEPLLPDTIQIGKKKYKIKYRTDRAELEEMAMWNWIYRQMWEDLNDNGHVWLLKDVFKSAIEGDSWVILQFYGMSYSGKSWLAIAKALELKLFLNFYGYDDVVIKFARNWAETLSLLQELKKGDIIICDEETDLMGEDSDTERAAMSNVLRSSRALGINIFFLDPEPKPKPNVDAWIRVAGTIPDLFKTMSIVYAHNIKLIGLDFTDIPLEDPDFQEIMTEYEHDKLENIRDLIRNRGRVGVDLTTQQVQMATELANHAKHLMNTEGVRITKELLTVYADDVGIVGSIAMVNKVIIRAYQMVHGSGIFKRIDMGIHTIDVLDAEYGPIPEDFLPFIEEHIEEWRLKWNSMTGDSVSRAIVNTFLTYISDPTITQDGAIEKTIGGVSNRETLSRHMGALSNLSGWLTELYLLHKNPTWEHGGMGTNDPDLIDHENKRVISVKFRSNKDPYVKDKRLRADGTVKQKASVASSEIQYAIEHNYDLWCLVFSLRGTGAQYGLVAWAINIIESSQQQSNSQSNQDS